MKTSCTALLAALLGTAIASALAAPPTEAAMPQSADAATVYRLRITHQRPPCSGPTPGLPIMPNDPGAITAPGGERRCYGTRPAEMELWLPAGRYAWLDAHAGNPAAWIAVGPVLVDPGVLEPPPLGLRITGTGPDLALETRYGDGATLTPLAPGRWQPVQSADGGRFWVQVESGAGP